MTILNFITKTKTLKPAIRNNTINTNLSKRISPDLYASFSNLNFAGVYRIGAENDKNDCYIGGSYNVSFKITHHLNLLYRGEHHSKGLQEWVNINGLDNIDVSILKWCKPNPDEFENWEQYYLDLIKPKFNAILNKKNVRYEIGTSKPFVHYNRRTLNEFGHQIISRISDTAEHKVVKFIVDKNINDERINWKPTIIINTEDLVSRTRGDITNIPKTKKNWSEVDITEMPIVRRNIGFNAR